MGVNLPDQYNHFITWGAIHIRNFKKRSENNFPQVADFCLCCEPSTLCTPTFFSRKSLRRCLYSENPWKIEDNVFLQCKDLPTDLKASVFFQSKGLICFLVTIKNWGSLSSRLLFCNIIQSTASF